MSIANKAFGAIGPKVFSPEGPLGANSQFPFPQFDFGEVVMGDKESQFIYLQLVVEASITLNQGDFLVWDNTFTAIQALAGASQLTPGSGVGTFFLGGRFGDPAAAPNANAGNLWSFTFAPGVYGVWAQRFGVSAGNWGTITAQADTAFSTAVAGQLAALASAGTHGATIPNVFTSPTSLTFTGATTSGSNVLTGIAPLLGNLMKGLKKGLPITGTGLNAGCTIADISGSTITLANRLNSAGPNATASATGITFTVDFTACWATFTTGLFTMNVDGTQGMIPNSTLSGTGVGTSAILTSIQGNPGQQVANVTVANTATEATPVLVTGAGYIETMLRLPYVSVQS